MVINSLKEGFGVNIYEMMGACFLFEFPNRNLAEQILQGEWIWKKKVKLEWWNPPAGCMPASCKHKTKWIRAMSLPLHLWSNETFHEIRDLCGGWKATEEEAERRNHQVG